MADNFFTKYANAQNEQATRLAAEQAARKKGMASPLGNALHGPEAMQNYNAVLSGLIDWPGRTVDELGQLAAWGYNTAVPMAVRTLNDIRVGDKPLSMPAPIQYPANAVNDFISNTFKKVVGVQTPQPGRETEIAKYASYVPDVIMAGHGIVKGGIGLANMLRNKKLLSEMASSYSTTAEKVVEAANKIGMNEGNADQLAGALHKELSGMAKRLSDESRAVAYSSEQQLKAANLDKEYGSSLEGAYKNYAKTGGKAPVTFENTPGMPDVMGSFDPTGSITGTPIIRLSPEATSSARQTTFHEGLSHAALDPAMNGGKEVISDALASDLIKILEPKAQGNYAEYLRGSGRNGNYGITHEILANLNTGPKVSMMEKGIISSPNSPITMQNLIDLAEKDIDFRMMLPHIGDINHYLMMLNKLPMSFAGVAITSSLAKNPQK